ncbi:MAG: hypothetical protein ACTSXX_07705 [Candidatus Baldrarchaeia archaeon]
MSDERKKLVDLAVEDRKRVLHESKLQRVCQKLDEPWVVLLETLFIFLIFYCTAFRTALEILPMRTAVMVLFSELLLVCVVVVLPTNVLLSSLCTWIAIKHAEKCNSAKMAVNLLKKDISFLERVFNSSAEVINAPTLRDFCRMIVDGKAFEIAYGPRPLSIRMRDFLIAESDVFDGIIGRYLVVSLKRDAKRYEKLKLFVTPKYVIKEYIPKNMRLLPDLSGILEILRRFSKYISLTHEIIVQLEGDKLTLAIHSPLPYYDDIAEVFKLLPFIIKLTCLELSEWFEEKTARPS